MVAEESGEVVGIGKAKGEADLGDRGIGVSKEVAGAVGDGAGDEGLGRGAGLLADEVAKIVGREEEGLGAGGDGGQRGDGGIGRGREGRGEIGFQARE